MPEQQMNKEELLNYYADMNTNPDSFQINNSKEIATIEKDTAKMVAEILSLLAGNNISAESRSAAEKYLGESLDKKGGIAGFIEKFKKGYKDIKEKFEKISKWMKKYKVAIIIVLIGIAGLVAALYFFR